MKNTKKFDLKTLDTLSLKELRAINSAVFAAKNRAERKADKVKATSGLIKVELDRWEAVSNTDRKRFAGGFFREQGRLNGRLYAKSKTGILYIQDTYGRSWEKVA